MAFVSDHLCSGRRPKCVTLADDCRHERVNIAVEFSIGGEYATRLLDQAARSRSYRQAQRIRPRQRPGFRIISLTMSYFHTGTRTIIGAEAFHCPVRDGKEWDHLAMVIRLNLLFL